MIQTINYILSSLTVLAQIVILFLFYLYFFSQKGLRFFKNNYLVLAFTVALTATSGSLFYSEIAGYEPCKLCWFQRIFMYPQVFILGLALYKKENLVAPYSLLLSLIGAAIALYHYLLQLNIAPSLPCSAVGYSVACSKIFVMNFGYITIPFMAFSAFLLLIFLALIKKKGKAIL